MITKLGHGHRRTQSDNFYGVNPHSHITIKFSQIENEAPEIKKCLETSTRKNKTKTILIEDLELSTNQQQQNQMFMFGRNHAGFKSASMNPHSSKQILSKIPQAPQKRSKSYLSNKQNKQSTLRRSQEKHKKQKKVYMHSKSNMNLQKKQQLQNLKVSNKLQNKSVDKFNLKVHKKSKTSKIKDKRKVEPTYTPKYHLASSYYFHFDKQIPCNIKKTEKQAKNCKKGKKNNHKKSENQQKQNKKNCFFHKQYDENSKKNNEYLTSTAAKDNEDKASIELEADWQKQFISQTIIKDDPIQPKRHKIKTNLHKNLIKQKFMNGKQRNDLKIKQQSCARNKHQTNKKLSSKSQNQMIKK